MYLQSDQYVVQRVLYSLDNVFSNINSLIPVSLSVHSTSQTTVFYNLPSIGRIFLLNIYKHFKMSTSVALWIRLYCDLLDINGATWWHSD